MIKRSFSDLIASLSDKRYLNNLKNIFSKNTKPIDFLLNYIKERKSYPKTYTVRTPTKSLKMKAFHYHDLLTINEIFFREDYKANENINCIVDIGSNIGISCLYFLSRNNNSKIYSFEPLEENIKKLEKHINTNDYSNRIIINKKAVSNLTGDVLFGVEPTGRYCGINLDKPKIISVPCIHINDVLENIFLKENYIDILKIDTEGAEFDTIQAIAKEYWKRIKRIYAECTIIDKTKENDFSISIEGNVTTYSNKLFL